MNNIFHTLTTYSPAGSNISPGGVIENQVRDLLDEATLETLKGVNPEATVSSIHKDYLERLNSGNPLQPTKEYRLSNFIQKLPHGIIDKKATGIGATTLEMKSPRHSIVVMPTKRLAYNKYRWATENLGADRALYIGTAIGESEQRVTEEEINNYIELNNSFPKKFLVVADSLNYLINTIGDNVYESCFLMIDEIDLLQADSNYRPRIESVIDHYFKFNIKNRCIITATMGEFSNPLFQNECRFEIEELTHKTRNIRLIHINESDSINYVVKKEIESYPEDKILIAYNTISQAKNIISMLNEELQSECSIMCSESSRNDAGDYCHSLNEDSSLPKRINFMTCTYFSGIDIGDSYHLITVSSVKNAHQMLSPKKITQVYGRCRLSDGILSDTIIYNTINLQPEFIRTPQQYRKALIRKADKVLELMKSADKLVENRGSRISEENRIYNEDLKDLFEIMKNAIFEKALEKTFMDKPIQLIRKTIKEDEYDIAYLNIDFLIERDQLFTNLYNSPEELHNTLISEGHQVILVPHEDNRTNEEKSVEETIESQTEHNYKEIKDRLLTTTIAELKERAESLPAGILKKYLEEKIITCSKEERTTLDRFKRLYPYVETDKLLDYLYDIRHQNIKAYKSLNYAIMFWCLAEDHPLRVNMRQAFDIGQEYISDEIHNKMQPIVKYHFHKTIKKGASISLFKAYFETERPRSTYRVIRENPKDFEERKTSIAKNDNNLLKYFFVN